MRHPGTGSFLLVGLLALLLAACGSSPSGSPSGGPGSTNGGTTTGSSMTTAPGPTTTSTTPPAGVSDNAYFPLVAGSTWRYRTVSGPAAGSSETIHISGVSPGAAGTATVNAQISVTTSSGTPASMTATYTVFPGGKVEVRIASFGAAGASMSVSGSGGVYTIPTQQDIDAGTTFTDQETLTASVAGAPMPITETLKETATPTGTQTVTVPAGTYSSAAKIALSIQVTGGVSVGGSIDMTASYDMYLAKGVGMVESTNGTATSTVMGISHSSPTGEVVLVSYTR